MSSVLYCGKKICKYMANTIHDDGMKQAGIHKNNLLSTFFFNKGKFYFPVTA